MLLAMGLLMCSSYMLNALNQPEFQQGMVMTEAGLQLSEPTPNPSYVGGMKRSCSSSSPTRCRAGRASACAATS
ncbi:MAG: hypothetical protein ACLTSG_14075 [Lachnospiraceae bacterium]